MMMMNRMALAFFVASALSLPLIAQDFGPFSSSAKRPDTQATLLSERSTITSGEPFTVGIQLSHPEGWHSYYKNSGIIGESLHTDWELPEGFTVEYQGWPTPHLSESFGYQSIGYEGTVTHLYTITPPPSLVSGESITLTAKTSWQMCEAHRCVFEDATLPLSLSISDKVENDAEGAERIASARSHLPTPLPSSTQLSLTEEDNLITLTLSPAGTLNPNKLHFFDEDGQVDVQKPHLAAIAGDTLTLKLPRNQGNDLEEEAPPALPSLTGILTDGTTAYFVSREFGSAPPEAWSAFPSEVFEEQEAEATSSGTNLLAILGGMFIGGLILNLMPCVFPVIGIKIMGFVDQAGHDRKKVMFHGIAFAGGVLASFWLLSTIMLLGGIKNWGGQLENPYVMLALIVVMLLLAMNMFGVFEIGTSATGVGSNLAQKDGLSGSFFSGVLATVVATPCSAPFLGTALGAAVALPTFWFFTAFTIMALGLSLPYLLLSAFPDLVRKLPRPGAWMESFKQGMSFLLFATVGYLLWVYSFQVFEHDNGQKGLFVMLGLSLIASGAWVWGRWTTPIRPAKTQWIARTLTLALIVIGIMFAKPGVAPGSIVESSDGLWQKWSKEKEQMLLAEGTPVFVDFTARWCLTCQVNKKNAYTTEVLEAFHDSGVVLLKADKTSSNPAIDAELQALNRTAIPVNVLYAPTAPGSPQITPEVLSPGLLLNLIEKHL